MNLQIRLKRLERARMNNGEAQKAAHQEENELEICEHPPSMFRLYRDYPAFGHPDKRLVVKGHCNACGFDDYLWFGYALTEEQETCRQELMYSARDAYDLELINAGLVSYVLFPPSSEVQIRFTGKVSI